MSDTTETAESRIREESAAIEMICERVGLEVGGGDTSLAVDFAKIFLSKAPPEFLTGRSSEELVHLVSESFHFLNSSKSDQVDVSITNPEGDSESWDNLVTVVRTNVSERPFIIDTIREYLQTQNLAIDHIVYPLIDIDRDSGGDVVAVQLKGNGTTRESLVHCEVTRVTDPDELVRMEAELSSNLSDVVRATDDFESMLDTANSVITALDENATASGYDGTDITEVQDFIRWLRDGGFVFLGYRRYDLVDGPGGKLHGVVRKNSGLGILCDQERSRFSEPVPIAELGKKMQNLIEHGPALVINKTNARATVHRIARMDDIGIKQLDENGRLVGIHRFVGLFTSKTYTEDAENVPILRKKLSQVLKEAGAEEGSHDYKEISTIFNSIPTGQLLISAEEDLASDVRSILNSYHDDHVHVSLRPDILERGVTVMVIIPEDRFSAEVREDIEEELLRVLHGQSLSSHLAMSGGGQARLHFYIAVPEVSTGEVGAAQLEELVGGLLRTWSDKLRDGLEEFVSQEEAVELSEFYCQAFNAEYQAATDPVIAAEDALHLEAMRADRSEISIAFSNRGVSTSIAGVKGATELKVYLLGERLILSDFMPILEDVGLRVIAANPYEVELLKDSATIYIFAVQDHEEHQLAVDNRGELLSEIILASRSGDVVSDSLNALVLSAGLHWREVDVLRGYLGYAFQIGVVPSRVSIRAALIQYPGIARELFELFAIKFDPDSSATKKERLAEVAQRRKAFFRSLQRVSALADDRALRRLEELINVTVRTNFYRHGGSEPTCRSGGVPYISFKFSCRSLEFLQRTQMLYEVWVHSARMEGVHLRGASVARGGIRWSDRPDDYRTEILGLVKTQMVKNAVIVPAGSKGGFVPRLLPDEPEARFEEGKKQYETLIRGMLDITDNLVEGKVQTPDRVVAFDGADPYLVVAADKGTARFSDEANTISTEYGFWLNDAFASGGSNGYDHKAVGITARGAWECVLRHFREMGKDIDSEPFTAVGIGDMSGDVFGNGMLMSEQTQLIAAFDHRHIFIDPDPDPSTSYAERKRLFGMERSSWEDYDPKHLSKGGMVISRGAKEVGLTSEAQVALGISDEDSESLNGESLVQAVLKAPVELLWNGGIGTFVKATAETDPDAGDPPNDLVRVNAPDLRCKVVGEGGNLGFTQDARVEYSLLGGAINTDAIDNSGGVDMSDHEVNLKILLAHGVASGSLSVPDRNELLEELTESVAASVLQNNRSQSLAISLDELRVRESVDDFRDLMFALEKTAELDRNSEALPTADALVERRESGHALARPELCVLLAYSKLSLMGRLLRSRVPDDAVTESYLLGYFPVSAIAAAGQESLEAHRLRRQIIASQLTNDLVDLMGSTFVNRLVRDTGHPAKEVVNAWLIASRLSDHRALLSEIENQQSKVSPRITYRWLLGLGRVLERTTRWVLQNIDKELSSETIVGENLQGLATLRDSFGDVVAGEERDLFAARVSEIREVGADESFSERLMTLRFLDQMLDILEIARETGADVLDTARAYYRISEELDLPWLHRNSFAAASDDQWEQRAARVLSEDLARAHRRLVVAVLTQESSDEPWKTTRALLKNKGRNVRRFKSLLEQVKAEETPGSAAVSVVAREVSTLARSISSR